MAIKATKFGTKYVEEEGIVVEKECTKCRELKSITEFPKEAKNFAGVKGPCRPCFNAKATITRRKYREKNPEKVREWNRNSYWNNPEKYKQNSERWRVENPERRMEYNKKYSVENADRLRELAKIWESENREKISAGMHNRRAIKLGLPGLLTETDILSLHDKFQGCALSDEPIAHLDHFIPLSVGGPGSVPGNIIIISQTLNSSKGSKNPFEWFEDNKERFELEQSRFDSVVSYLAELNGMSPEQYRKYVYQCFSDSEGCV